MGPERKFPIAKKVKPPLLEIFCKINVFMEIILYLLSLFTCDVLSKNGTCKGKNKDKKV